jgi:DNA primase
LSQGLSFRKSVAYLQRQIPPAADSGVLGKAASFYQLQLHRHAQAIQYLQRRGLRHAGLIEELGIGYAPAVGKLRNHLVAHGYGLDRLLETGLITPQGRDTFCRRVIFNLAP